MNTQLPSALDPGDDVQQIEPDKAMPRALVLDIEEPMENFQKVLSQFVSLAIDLQTAVADVLDCIKDRQDAEYEISYSGYQMSPDLTICLEEGGIVEEEGVEPEDPATQLVEISEESLHAEESVKYVGARDEFARELLKLFDLMRLYRNGKLFYELQQLLGNTLVLGKIGVPVLTNDQRTLRHANNIARQTRVAAERRGAENAALRESSPQPFVSLLEQFGEDPHAGLRHLLRRAHRLG